MNATLLERRREILRREIGKVAIDLFVDHGFDKVTVDEIASVAGISPRTFFRYYSSKDDIVLELARRLDERLIAAVAARPADEGPITALREGFRATSRMEPSERGRVLSIARILGSVPALRAQSQGERIFDNDGLVRRLVAELSRRSRDRRLPVAVRAMVAAAGMEFEEWATGGGRGDLSKRVTDALVLLEAGLARIESR